MPGAQARWQCSQLTLAAGNNHFLMKKETFLQDNFRVLDSASSLDADTQLGAFGPGADPMRSKAPYALPRLNFCLGKLSSTSIKHRP